MERIIHDHFDYIGIIHPNTGTFEFYSRRPGSTMEKIGEILSYGKCRKYIRDRFQSCEMSAVADEMSSLDAIIKDMNTNGRRTIPIFNDGGKDRVYKTSVQLA